MAYTNENLRQTAIGIRDEFRAGANTAYRVGSLLLAMIDAGIDVDDLKKLFLSSTEDDEAAGLITFLKGLISKDVIKALAGITVGENGSGISVLPDGKSQAVVDYLYVKVKAIFDELEVKKKTYVGGEQILSPAGIKCIRVEELADVYRCYFKSEEDGVEIENQFTAGTLAIAQEDNIKVGVSQHVGNRYYWRAVTEVGADYIDLSKTDCDPNIDNDIPAAGDDIVGLGHLTDITRQGAIIMSSINEVSPSIIMYQGINDFTLVDKDVIGFDFDKATGKARMCVYGDAYIGDKDRNSYIEHTTEKGVMIKGQLAVGSKIGDGRTIESAFKSAEDDIITAQKEAKEASAAASEASNAAVSAASVASSAASVATSAKNRLDGWATDNVISPLEKQGIKDEIVRIDADKADVSNGYTKYALGEATDYDKAHLAYSAALISLSDTEVENIPIPEDFATKQTAYYTYRTTALDAISTAAKQVASDAAKTAEDAKKNASDALTAIAGYDYLKQAIKEGTAFQGGLGLTSTIMFGETVNDEFVVKSGVNGIYDATKPGGGIAYWAGGVMKDLAEDYQLPWTSTPQPENPQLYAKSVTRMDGTGYDVGGNFWKDTEGKIHCDPLSFFVGEEKVGDILSLFTPVRINNILVGAMQNVPFVDGTGKGLLKIGQFILSEDSNGNLGLTKTDGTPATFFTTGGLSAKGGKVVPSIWEQIPIDRETIGFNENGLLTVIGGGGGLASVTVKLGDAAYNSVDGVVSLPAYPTTFDWDAITSGKPTTLSGYGITDAVLTTDSRLTNTRPASDVYAWAKAVNKPSYTWTEISSKPSWIGSTKPSYAYSEITGTPPATDLSNYVTLNTVQSISGQKHFNGITSFNKLGLKTLPTEQPIVINGINNATSNGYLPAIGFHIPGITYANIVLSREGRFELLNSKMDNYVAINASNFIIPGGTASHLLRADGQIATFQWTSQTGQPSCLWGGNTQHTYYVYNPANFRVANANTVGDIAAANLLTKQNWTSTVDGRYIPLSGGNLAIGALTQL